MSSKSSGIRPVWQHPFVNVFKQFEIEKWKKLKKEGDVVPVMDKKIKCTIYRIQGSIPAGNYIQIPKTPGHSLGLTGRYFYISFKPTASKYFVVHIDAVDQDESVVRVSFSNLFKEFRSTSTWLQFPFACLPAKGSVEEVASRGSREIVVGPAPLSQRWTLLVLDLSYMLSTYANRKFSCVKSIRLCANMSVKNCFTSNIQYDPRLSAQHARQIGITNIDENCAPLPRDMSFFIPKDKTWDDLYDVIRFPVDAIQTNELRLPFDSIQRHPASGLLVDQKKAKSHRALPGVIMSVKRTEGNVVDTRRNNTKSRKKTNLEVTTSKVKRTFSQPDPGFITLLPMVGLNEEEMRDFRAPKSDDCGTETVTKQPSDDVTIHVHGSSEGDDDEDVIINRDPINRTTTSHLSVSQRPLPVTLKADKTVTARKPPSALYPNPILHLSKVVGYGSGTKSPSHFRGISLWQPYGDDQSASSSIVVYAVQALVVAMETVSRKQHVFVGHTNKISSIAFNQQHHHAEAEHPLILASSQIGQGGMIKMWNYNKRKCVATIETDCASSIYHLCLSRTGAVLAASGRDQQGKSLVVVYDTSSVLRSGSYNMIAKAHTPVKINRIQISPTNDMRLVTCGDDNIRFWRVKSNQLRSCPITSPSYDGEIGGDITDVMFAPPSVLGDCEDGKNYERRSEEQNPYNVYACTSNGKIMEIDFTSLNVCNLYQPTTSSATDNNKNRGLKFTALKMNKSFVVTGSQDGLLRFWPLTLKSVFVEAEHEGEITDININPDGSKILVSTDTATLGYLDMSTRRYTTLMRSHLDKINDSSMDGLRQTVSTCSADMSIQVWQTQPTIQQLYHFGTPDDQPTTVSCHPTQEIFAVGFNSGTVRLFDCESSSILSEHPNAHLHSRVISVIFTSVGDRLISRCREGTICLFDTNNPLEYGVPLLRKLTSAACGGEQYYGASLNVSPDGRKCAYIGRNHFTVTLATTGMLDHLMKIDVSSGLKVDDNLPGLPVADCPLLLAFSPSTHNHLLVVTRRNRLLKIDARNGSLVQIASNIHKKHTTAVCASEDGKYLVTAGDHLVKVWEYEMLNPNCYQVFRGHCSPIRHVQFTLDSAKLLSIGEDVLLVWNFINIPSYQQQQQPTVELPPPQDVASESPSQESTDDDVEKNDDKSLNLICDNNTPLEILEEERSSDAEDGLDIADSQLALCATPKSVRWKNATPPPQEEICPQPSDDIPAPSMQPPQQDADNITWQQPETLHASDLDSSDISEFTIDAGMIERLIENGASVDSPNVRRQSTLIKEKPTTAGDKKSLVIKMPDLDSSYNDLQIIPERENKKQQQQKEFTELPQVSAAKGSNYMSDYANKVAQTKISSQQQPPRWRKVDKNEALVKRVWKKPSTDHRPTNADKVQQSPINIKPASKQLTNVLSYYKPRHHDTAAATKTFVAPQGQQGLKLRTVIGYNGNGRGNLIWSSSSGVLLYTCGCIVVIEHLTTNVKRYAVGGHTEEISCLALQQNLQVFVSASGRNQLVPCQIVFWDMSKLEILAVLEPQDNEIVSMAVSPDDRFLLTIGGHDETLVSIWTTYDGRTPPQLLTCSTVSPTIIQACWNSYSANEFTTVGDNASIIFWLVDEAVSDHKMSLKLNIPELPPSCRKNRNTKELNVFTCACHGVSELCYVGSQDGLVSVWSTKSNQCLIHWYGDVEEICVLRSSTSHLLLAGVSGYMRTWLISDIIKYRHDGKPITTNALRYEQIQVKQKVTSCSFTSTLDMGIIGTSSGCIFHVDRMERAVVPLISSHMEKVTGITFDCEGRFFATCCNSGSICIWSAQHFQLAAKFKIADMRCTCLVFSPAHDHGPVVGVKLLAVGFNDGSVRLYNIKKLTRDSKLKSHQAEISSIQFTLDGSRLVTSDVTGRVVVTSLEDKVIQTLETDHKSPITNIDISENEDVPILDNDGVVVDSHPHLCLFTTSNRRVSVWSCQWKYNSCVLVDWITFPAPSHGIRGIKGAKTKKDKRDFPPSICYFHPSNLDVLLYTGYGMAKSLQQYSLSQKKIVKTTKIPDWVECMQLLSSGKLAVAGTSSRLLQLIDVEFGTFQDFRGHVAPVEHIAIAPKADILISSSAFGELLVWDICVDDAMQD